MLPDYLKGLSNFMPADTTTPELIPDLTCNEELSHDGSCSISSNTSEECIEHFCASPSSRSCSPLSAVDILQILTPMFCNLCMNRLTIQIQKLQHQILTVQFWSIEHYFHYILTLIYHAILFGILSINRKPTTLIY